MKGLSLLDFPELHLGNKKRNARFVSIINNVVSNPSGSIPQHSNGLYEAKATYNLLGNKQVKLSSIESAVQSHGSSQLADLKKVLVIHDFCFISYNGLKETKNLGYLNTKDSRGIISYNSIAVRTDGLPLSLLYQKTFNRAIEDYGKSADRNAKEFEDKESYHWHKGITATNSSLKSDTHRIHISDRESDIYDLFFFGGEPNCDLLLRSIHDRKLDNNDYLWQHLEQTISMGEVRIPIPKNRTAQLEEITVSIKFKKVTITRPSNSKSKLESVQLTAILLQQVSPQLEWQKELVEWKLLTSLEVLNLVDALQCVKWYCFRWLIERFHFVLKSGTKIEKLQLEEAKRLQKAIHIYSIAAMQLMKLTYLARITPEVSCELVLTREQWMVLYMLTFKNKNMQLPIEPPTMEEAVKWIGKMGGHLGRKSDGMPGLEVIWRGYRKLMTSMEVYYVMTKVNSG